MCHWYDLHFSLYQWTYVQQSSGSERQETKNKILLQNSWSIRVVKAECFENAQTFKNNPAVVLIIDSSFSCCFNFLVVKIFPSPIISLNQDLQTSGSFRISSWKCTIIWLTVLRITPEVSSDDTETLDQSFACGGVDRAGNVCREKNAKTRCCKNVTLQLTCITWSLWVTWLLVNTMYCAGTWLANKKLNKNRDECIFSLKSTWNSCWNCFLLLDWIIISKLRG